MEILYYPSMYVDSDDLLKQLLLSWGKVSTIIPPSEKDYIDRYLSGKIKTENHARLEHYKAIYDVFGSRVVDFTVIGDKERKDASYKMLDLVSNWNQDTHFYDSLKINKIEDCIGKTFEWYWFLNEKLEHELVQLLLEEHLVANWAPGEIVGYKEVGKSYMSIIADSIKETRNARLITDDGFFLAAKSGVSTEKISRQNANEAYEVVTLAIPQVFIDTGLLHKLSWTDIKAIREDLLPFTENYYREVEEYQNQINSLTSTEKTDEAFLVFCEFCERVAESFAPLAKEKRKMKKYIGDTETVGMITGMILPAAKLTTQDPSLTAVCDIASIAVTAGMYSAPKQKKRQGFEYLENLSRKLTVSRFKNMMSCLVPKCLQ